MALGQSRCECHYFLNSASLRVSCGLINVPRGRIVLVVWGGSEAGVVHDEHMTAE